MPKNNERIPYIEGESAEQDIILDAEQSRQIGAKVLAAIHYEDKNRNPIVASSYEKARKNKEKFPDGSSAEQRNLAHLRRLDRMIEKGGSKLEKRIWQESIKNIDLVQTENITESTWRSLQRENRNHGGGDIELTPQLKEMTAQQYRDVQLGELEDIANYLSAEECPYPRWYKIYVWNGLTNLSRKTKNIENGFPVLQKRDKTTTAGFPKLSPAAIAKVYDDITSYYDIATDAKEAAKSTDKTDGTVEKLVKNGSFAKLYSYELSRLTKSVEVPEKTEDVHGEWIEYDLNHINNLTEAAEGTPWCIVSPTVARNYLKYGSFGHGEEVDDDWDDDNWDDDWENGWDDDNWNDDWDDNDWDDENNDYDEEQTDEEIESTDKSVETANETAKGRFILFHLTDPDTGLPSKRACASIRLDPKGNVAEISGICGDSNQRLNDSLVPIVKEKAMQYPGGEQKMQAFLDNEEIIRLEEKFKKGEAFTKDEVNFIFENKRKIEALNPYNRDPRIEELQDAPTLLANGTEVNVLANNLPPDKVIQNLNLLLGAKANINLIMSKLDPRTTAVYYEKLRAAGAKIDLNNLISELDSRGQISACLNSLLKAGADVNDLVPRMKPENIANHLDSLRAAGAEIDADDLASKLTPTLIAANLKRLLAAGAKIDVDNLVPQLSSSDIHHTLNQLLDAGAKADDLVPKIMKDPDATIRNLNKLLSAGAKISDLSAIIEKNKNAYYYPLEMNAEILLDNGADVDLLVSKIHPDDVAENLKFFLEKGAKIDVDDLVSKISSSTIYLTLEDLLDAGASADVVIPKLDSYDIMKHFDKLRAKGAKIDDLLSRFDSSDIIRNLDDLIDAGVKIDDLVKRLDPEDVVRKRGKLLAANASEELIDSIANKY